MGEGYSFNCTGCGHSVTIFAGVGFLAFDKEYHEILIDQGKFGEHAKRIMEEDPDFDSVMFGCAYLCSCGNLEDGTCLTIRRKGKRAYSSSQYCSECGKRMRRVPVPEEIRCIHCGEIMKGAQDLLWD